MNPNLRKFAHMAVAAVSTYVIIFGFMSMFLFTGTLNSIKENYPSPLTLGFELLLALLIVAGLGIAIRAMDRKKLRDFGLRFRRADAAFLLIVLGVTSAVCIGFVWTVSAVRDTPLEFRAMDFSFGALLAFGLLVKAAAAFHEELLARGYFMSKLSDMHPAKTILVTAVMFALLHVPVKGMEPYAMLSWFFGGITYGYMYAKSRNLWIPTAAHTFHNFINDLAINANGLSLLTLGEDIDGGAKTWYKLTLMAALLLATHVYYRSAKGSETATLQSRGRSAQAARP